MAISEKKMQIVIDNYFKSGCDVNTSIRQAFEKGFRIGVMKGQCSQPSVENKCFDGMTNREIISEFVERDDSFAIMVDEVNGTVSIELSLDFWNTPYKAERGE